MHSNNGVSGLGLWLAGTALALSATTMALAQPAPAPGAPPGEYAGTPDGGDPPALAGRLARLRGTVSFHAASETDWRPASINYPVTTGDAVWTEPKSDATIDIAGDRIILAGATELDIAKLDQANFIATEAQGAIFLRLHDLPDGQTLTINTPRAAIHITQPGKYEIVAGDTTNPTAVSVVEGAAHIEGSGAVLDVGPQQTGLLSGSGQVTGNVTALQPDGFLSTVLAEERPRPHPAYVPPSVQYMTGAEDLDANGTWSPEPQYGAVWYPQTVPVGWVPYRFGHWAFIAPWGWTWVDNAPWGFAPFHYGRWVSVGGRWGWVAAYPGVAVGFRPVYAPALVSFVGVAPGVALGIGLGGGFGVGVNVGWVPLGFSEPFVPWYHTSPGYFQNVNRVNVTNINSINVTNIRNVTVNHYGNAAAATVAPANAMTSAANLSRAARPLPAAGLAQATPFAGRLPVAPTAATPGVTPAVAHSFGITAPVHPAVAAAGPAIHPALAASAIPALRPAPAAPTPYGHPGGAIPAGGHAGLPGAPAAHGFAPQAAGQPGLPPLRSPGQLATRPATPAINAPGLHPAAQPHAAPAAVQPHAASAAQPQVVRPSSSYGAPGHSVPAAAHHTAAQAAGSGLPVVQRPTHTPQPYGAPHAHAAPQEHAGAPAHAAAPHEAAPRPAPEHAAPHPAAASHPSHPQHH